MRSVFGPGITSITTTIPREQVISRKWCGKEASCLESVLLKAQKAILNAFMLLEGMIHRGTGGDSLGKTYREETLTRPIANQ